MFKARNTTSDLMAANDCDRIPDQFNTTLWAEQDQMVKKWYSLNDPIAPAQCPYTLIHQYTRSSLSLLARFDSLLECLGGAQRLCGSV